MKIVVLGPAVCRGSGQQPSPAATRGTDHRRRSLRAMRAPTMHGSSSPRPYTGSARRYAPVFTPHPRGHVSVAAAAHAASQPRISRHWRFSTPSSALACCASCCRQRYSPPLCVPPPWLSSCRYGCRAQVAKRYGCCCCCCCCCCLPAFWCCYNAGLVLLLPCAANVLSWLGP